MAELARGERRALLRRAEELLDHVTALGTVRENIEDAEGRAASALAARVRPARFPVLEGADAEALDHCAHLTSGARVDLRGHDAR